jgi:hypothetical protein
MLSNQCRDFIFRSKSHQYFVKQKEQTQIEKVKFKSESKVES